jgi:uncharacterized protein (DUF1697 family)
LVNTRVNDQDVILRRHWNGAWASGKTVMQTFVVLLRGINVGSTRKVPMADLRTTCLKLGWQRPETYIQSGNLIVDAPGDTQQVRRVLEPELGAHVGERTCIAGAALWIDYGLPGVAGSKLTPALLDKACGSPTTGRNWNTVLKIGDMLAARNKA